MYSLGDAKSHLRKGLMRAIRRGGDSGPHLSIAQDVNLRRLCATEMFFFPAGPGFLIQFLAV